MTTNESKKVSNWVQHRNDLKKRIDSITTELHRMTSFHVSAAAAGEAKRRLDNFIHLNGGSESAVRDARKGQLNSLKAEAERTAKEAKADQEKQKAISTELDRLNKELININFLAGVEGSGVEGLREFVVETLAPLKTEILRKLNELEKLNGAAERLRNELAGFAENPPKLDEAAIVHADISAHSAELIKLRDARDRRQATKDLLEQAEALIDGKQKQIEASRKKYSELLLDAVRSYTEREGIEHLTALKVIFEKAESYKNAAKNLGTELLGEVGINSGQMFMATVQTLSDNSRLFPRDDLTNMTLLVVNERLNSAAG